MEIDNLTLYLFIFLIFLPPGISAQNALTDTVEDPYMGLSFSVPEGWKAYNMEGSYLIGSDTQKGFALIMQNEYGSLNALQTGSMEGIIDEGNGTVLQPESYPEHFMENGIQISLAGHIEWQQVKAYAIGLITPYNSGITILTAVEPASFSQEYVDRVQFIARGMTFSKPKTHPVAEQWKTSLMGMRLTYMDSYSSGGSGGYGGYSDHIEIDLCQGQIFSYSDKSRISVDVGGGYAFSGGQNRGDGSWDVISTGTQPILVLSFYDNSIHRYNISMQGDVFYLDNRKYFRTRNADCNK